MTGYLSRFPLLKERWTEDDDLHFGPTVKLRWAYGCSKAIDEFLVRVHDQFPVLEATTRAFPHSRSDGLMFDPERKLIWGTDTNSQVYVLRVDREKAG
ncbi:MAG: hypothetical protein O3A00_15945 [Planctomycetota bacterium]|nr:hypothetical protein [Planctomycetota bacterium]